MKENITYIAKSIIGALPDLQNIIANLTVWLQSHKAILKKSAQILSISLIAGLTFYFYPMLVRNWSLASESSKWHITIEQDIEETQTKLQNEIATFDKKLNAMIPKKHYLVINTASNEFSLFKGEELVRKDKCSTGSYVLLKRGDKEKWMFKTPKGEFKIRGKTTAPVWKKPDWAFVEEGLPVPSYNHPSRFEYGVLGDYSLSLGDGYLIHGTLYQRFLGLPVTHGCIRLNDENLKLVYQSMSTGSKVFIY